MKKPGAAFVGRPAAADSETPTGASAASSYTYRVQLYPPSGFLRRWRGRVVTVDNSGRRRHWPSRSAGSRERLLRLLRDDAMRDIQWRKGGASVQIIVINS